MEEKDVINKESNSVYTELLYTAFEYFQDHPIMLVGVGLSACSTCFIMSACMFIEKRNSKGVN